MDKTFTERKARQGKETYIEIITMQELSIKTVCHVCSTQLELIRQTNSEGIDRGYAICLTCESITTRTCSEENIQTDAMDKADIAPSIAFIDNMVKISVDYAPLQKRILKLAQLLHKQTFK